MSKTPVSAIGEFGLIQKIKEWSPGEGHDLIIGIGDDAAGYRAKPDSIQLATMDSLVEGIDFDLTYTSMQHLGYKSVVSTISDIVAMNGHPEYVLISLMLPQKISVEMLESFYSGVNIACREFRVTLAGGDVSASSGNMMIAVSATGYGFEDDITRRKGAKPGDILVVTGFPGMAFAGLQILLREKDHFLKQGDQYQPQLDTFTSVLETFLAPKLRTEELKRLKTAGLKPSSMIDLSDGLASDLFHLCQQSGVHAVIDEIKLPVHPDVRLIAESMDENAIEWSLFGGEDYELLFTIGQHAFEMIESIPSCTVIGQIQSGQPGMTLIEVDGVEMPIEPQGWDHFRG